MEQRPDETSRFIRDNEENGSATGLTSYTKSTCRLARKREAERERERERGPVVERAGLSSWVEVDGGCRAAIRIAVSQKGGAGRGVVRATRGRDHNYTECGAAKPFQPLLLER